MRRRTPAALLAAALLGLASVAAEEMAEDLPDGPGRDETFTICTGCHGFALVRAQGLSAERWNATIDEMIERHGMAEIPAEDRALIVAYLAASFPPRQERGGWTNPFLKQ